MRLRRDRSIPECGGRESVGMEVYMQDGKVQHWTTQRIKDYFRCLKLDPS